jgi:group I intron endonuclease
VNDLSKCGVYVIRNLVNGKRYIGSAAVSFRKRWDIHKSDLNRGKHHNSKLQRAWAKYGAECFEFQIVEYCLPQHCIAQEQVYLDLYLQRDPTKVYNLHPIAGSSKGSRRTFEQRQHLSNHMKNLDPAVREKMDRARRNSGWSEEAKQRAKAKGKKATPEQRKKMSDSAKAVDRTSPKIREGRRQCAEKRRGIPLSDEVKAKIGAANCGKERSPELRAHLAEIARNMSPEQRKKIGDKSRGRVDSLETRERRRQSQIARHAREREQRCQTN